MHGAPHSYLSTRRRRPFLLLELLVAMTLLGMLIAFLLGAMRMQATRQHKLQEKSELLFALERCDLRLERLFASLVASLSCREESGCWILSGHIIHPLSRDPMLQGEQRFELRRMHEGRLELLINKERQLLLLGVQQISCRMLDKKSGEWQPELKEGLPLVLELKLEVAGAIEPLVWSYALQP